MLYREFLFLRLTKPGCPIVLGMTDGVSAWIANLCAGRCRKFGLFMFSTVWVLGLECISSGDLWGPRYRVLVLDGE